MCHSYKYLKKVVLFHINNEKICGTRPFYRFGWIACNGHKMQTLSFFGKINQTSGVHQKQDCLSWYLTSVYRVSCQKDIVKYSVQHLKTFVLYS